jgi:hypothetical protein
MRTTWWFASLPARHLLRAQSNTFNTCVLIQRSDYPQHNLPLLGGTDKHVRSYTGLCKGAHRLRAWQERVQIVVAPIRRSLAKYPLDIHSMSTRSILENPLVRLDQATKTHSPSHSAPDHAPSPRMRRLSFPRWSPRITLPYDQDAR